MRPALAIHSGSRFFRATPPLRVVLLRPADFDRDGFDGTALGAVR
jgi:hypothetical protein